MPFISSGLAAGNVAAPIVTVPSFEEGVRRLGGW